MGVTNNCLNYTLVIRIFGSYSAVKNSIPDTTVINKLT